MKVLVVNAGSSSLKYQLLDMETEEVIAKGNAERVGMDGSFLKHKAKGVETILKRELKNLVPLEQTINEARTIENLHMLIKNNGQDFNLTKEQMELAEKLQ